MEQPQRTGPNDNINDLLQTISGPNWIMRLKLIEKIEYSYYSSVETYRAFRIRISKCHIDMIWYTLLQKSFPTYNCTINISITTWKVKGTYWYNDKWWKTYNITRTRGTIIRLKSFKTWQIRRRSMESSCMPIIWWTCFGFRSCSCLKKVASVISWIKLDTIIFIPKRLIYMFVVYWLFFPFKWRKHCQLCGHISFIWM